MAAVASRSSLIGALLRNIIPVNRHKVLEFLRGLSRDELECLAEFQGACVLEAEYCVACHPYTLIADFFDPVASERWSNPDDRAHKAFIVLEYLKNVEWSVSIRLPAKVFKQGSHAS